MDKPHTQPTPAELPVLQREMSIADVCAKLDEVLGELRWQRGTWNDVVCLHCSGYGYLSCVDAPNELCPVCKGTRIKSANPAPIAPATGEQG
jgi:rubrerythrin